MMYVMLLMGMVVSGILFSVLLKPFSPLQLVKVIQGVALVTLLLNIFALWKQEARQPKIHLPRFPSQNLVKVGNTLLKRHRCVDS